MPSASSAFGGNSFRCPPLFFTDNFFRNHGMAQDLTGYGCSFLMLTKKDKRDAGLARAKRLTGEGDCFQTIVDNNYALCVNKNQMVGHKPPKIVSFLTNCCYGVDDPLQGPGNNFLTVVAKYREISRAVDGANQMALQTRQNGAPNDVEPRRACLHVAVRGLEGLCNMQGIGTGGRGDHHMGVAMGPPQVAVLWAAGVCCFATGTCGSCTSPASPPHALHPLW